MLFNFVRAQGRTAKLKNDIRRQIENSVIALETAHQAYAAPVESSNYQAQLLQAEKDKFAVGESTIFLIVQDEAYLAQSRSTEVAARSDWMKAQLALARSLGSLLEKNNIEIDKALRIQLETVDLGQLPFLHAHVFQAFSLQIVRAIRFSSS